MTDVHVRERVGPALTEVLGLPASISDGQARLLVADAVRTAATMLPADLARAVDAMFALSPDYRMATLRARQDALAEHLDRDLRTVRRRCDDAVLLLAEQLVIAKGSAERDGSDGDRNAEIASRRFVDSSWYTDQLDALVRLDRAEPEIREQRCVVATVADLTDVTASTGLLLVREFGTTLPEVTTDVDFGARLHYQETMPGGLAITFVRFPRPLSAGEQRWYGRTVRMGSGHQFEPRVLFSPVIRCDRFRLRIRFAEERTPVVVQRHEGPNGIGASDENVLPTVRPDEVGEVVGTFERLRPGWSYGFSWDPQ